MSLIETGDKMTKGNITLWVSKVAQATGATDAELVAEGLRIVGHGEEVTFVAFGYEWKYKLANPGSLREKKKFRVTMPIGWTLLRGY